MSDQRPVKPAFFVIIALAVVAVAGGAYLYTQQEAPGNKSAEEAAGIQPAASETATEAGVGEETAESVPAVTGFPGNTEGIMGERTIGDPDAPVKMTEYSSLTCGHCGAFHQNTLGKLKTEYVDTGKLFIRFVDFPLNAPALHATKTARCLPEGRFYDFQQLLFNTQNAWAYDAGYMTYLRQNAQLAGLSGDEFASCINNEELQEFILKRMTEGRDAHGIQSTPSFVFDDGTVINGSQPFEAFAKVIEARLAGENQQEQEAAE